MLEEQKQLIAQLEQERFTANKRAQHLENELNDKKKVFRLCLLHIFFIFIFLEDFLYFLKIFYISLASLHFLFRTSMGVPSS